MLLGSSGGDLQQALKRFAAECCKAGMRVSVAKTETLVLSRKPSQCTLHVSGTSLRQVEKFKYLGVVFTSDGRQEAELDARIAGDGAVMRQFQHSILRRGEVGKKAKLAIFSSVFVPIHTYSHECWVMTERVRSRIQASEMGFLRRISGVTLLDRVRSSEIRESLQVEPLLLRIERSQLRYYGHVVRMPQERIAAQILKAKPIGRRPRGRPRARWLDNIHSLSWSRLGI